MEKREYFSEIYRKYVKNQCSPTEVDELLAYLKTEGFQDIYELVTRDFASKNHPFDPILEQRLEQRLQNILSAETKQSAPLRRIAPRRRLIYGRIAAAAVIILIATPSFYLYLQSRKNSHVATKPETAIITKEIPPGGNKAILTLSGGAQIILDSIRNGALIQQGNTKVIKTDNGSLAYQETNEKPKEILYNTLTTPRGGQFQLELPDGTKVWLNAASSIKYPIAFSGSERNVEMNGEVYFEVAKNKTKPFHVTVNEMTVEVLGTHFNINSYSEKQTINTTLFEGSVKVKADNQSEIIKPGQQARLSGYKINILNNVDLDQVIAWKNGEIALTNISVKEIMQDISRWYDVDISYAGSIPDKKFYGSIDRNVPLSTVLKGLQSYGVVTKLEGKTIIVQ